MNIGKLQQPIGTLQIPSRFCKEFFKFAKLMRKIPNELGSQKRNASRSLPVTSNFLCVSEAWMTVYRDDSMGLWVGLHT